MIFTGSIEDRHEQQLIAELEHDNAPTKTPPQLERGINAPSRDHTEQEQR